MKIWRNLWTWIPRFSAKHSPIFVFSDGHVLWNPGFGKIAYLKEDRFVTVRWGLGDRKPYTMIVNLSDAQHWDSPHDSEALTDTEREDLLKHFNECYRTRKETVLFR